ncbi:MAG: hypothetical protein J6S31_01865 [Lachnospiraceae bacterium]|nr:hypothetical protein [Lachnospiraceae bacterium]
MAEQAGNILFDQIEQQMKRRNRARKTLNIVICLIIALLGITATIYKVRYEGGFITCFREMTVCATVLTTLTSIAMIPLNLFELKIGSEISSRVLFFFRLSSAVTEFIVLMITLIGFLPFFSDHPVIARYDMLNMHVLIPLLMIGTFIFNDSAIGKIPKWKLIYGLIIITIYAVLILTLILTNVVPDSKIPYSFLDIRNQPFWLPLLAFVVIFGVGYLLSWAFYSLNRKLSWCWYKGIASK